MWDGTEFLSQDKKKHRGKRYMTGAAMVMTALAEHKVEHIFGYPGGAALPLYDALYGQDVIHHTLVRHEQAAVHAAQGYARSTGKTGCVLVTSGPGATNTVTGIMDAFADSIPLVVITGQVSLSVIGTDAFQECDIVGITRSCTKHNYLVSNIADLPRILHEAFLIARSGRPGPVLVDIPKNIQNTKGFYATGYEIAKELIVKRHAISSGKTNFVFTPEAIAKAVMMMQEAKRPVIYSGGGVINAGPQASEALRELAQLTGFPVTSTLMGLGAFPASHKQWLGMLGMHGTYEANKTVHGADLIINIGARFDDRVTGRVDKFAPSAKKIHIDIDRSSINKIIPVDLGIAADCTEALKALVTSWKSKVPATTNQALKPWWQQIARWRQKQSLSFAPSETVIKPQYALQRLDALIKDKDTYVTTDVGQHQMWSAQHLGFEAPNHWMTSGGLGTMGYGLPAAIGVQTAHPKSLVVCVTGDASIQMNIQEMATAVQEKLPVKVLILNNGWMGMVRQWQELSHGERYSESWVESQPNFVKLAEAYGWTGLTCSSPKDLDGALRRLIETPGPCLLDCTVAKVENCYPMIPAGRAHNQMVMAPKPRG